MDVKFESTLKHTEIIPNFDTCDVFSILFLLPEFLFLREIVFRKYSHTLTISTFVVTKWNGFNCHLC